MLYIQSRNVLKVQNKTIPLLASCIGDLERVKRVAQSMFPELSLRIV